MYDAAFERPARPPGGAEGPSSQHRSASRVRYPATSVAPLPRSLSMLDFPAHSRVKMRSSRSFSARCSRPLRSGRRATSLLALGGGSSCIARSDKLDRARSRLYRSQILQENMRWKALAEIYTMHSFVQLCNLIFFCQNLPKFQIFARFAKHF